MAARLVGLATSGANCSTRLPTEICPQAGGRASTGAATGLLSLRFSGDKPDQIQLPAAAVRPLLELLKHMAQGTPVTMVPLRALLTTQEAADLLRVSRPHLIKLLETEKIPYKKVGTHRRIEYSAVANYQCDRDKAREAAMRRAELRADGRPTEQQQQRRHVESDGVEQDGIAAVETFLNARKLEVGVDLDVGLEQQLLVA